jgi:radical SAM protein with 4Fe4S-binding SPASM domain
LNKRLRDGINFISKLTPARAWNATRVLTSYFVSRISGRLVQWGYPVSISIEPTTSCNLRCPQCPSGLRSFSRPTGMLQQDLLTRTIDELSRFTSYLILYFQGEPYLNPRFFDYVKYASDKRMYTATSTNGHYLDYERSRKTVESGLDRLIISLDGASAETYKQYRVGGNFDTVVSGIRNLVKVRKELGSSTPHIILQFIVFSHNEHEIAEVKRLGAEMGADEVKIKTAQIYDYENGSELIPRDETYSRYKRENEKVIIKNKLLNHCWKMWHSCVVTWDGRIVPCCFDKDASHQLGDLKTETFASVWNGERYRAFRSSLLKSRKEVDICSNCSEGSSVWAE